MEIEREQLGVFTELQMCVTKLKRFRTTVARARSRV